MPAWWDLAGPAEFVSAIASDLRNGRNVVVLMPELSPGGLREAVQKELPVEDGWFWELIHPADHPGRPPLHLLVERYLGSPYSRQAVRVRDLAAAESFRGYLVWVDDCRGADWPPWRDFLLDYEVACRERPAHERSVFCAVARGTAALNPPREEVCLSLRCWQGQVDLLDMLLYCWSRFREKRWPVVQRRLAAAVCAGLALWDQDLADRLAGEPPRVLLDPQPVLARLALDLGWQDTGSNAWTDLWAAGLADLYEGRWRLHSALLALKGDTAELRSRMWTAQVSVVLPFLEEQRRDWLDTFQGILRVPYCPHPGRQIDTLEDLELPHLAQQLGRHPAVPSPVRTRLRRFAEVRNRLAHLELLTGEDWVALSDGN